MPFITLLDDRARPKGSRDPLGFELVWTYFGRKVIGNLTTITSSLENFVVALIGFHWANKHAAKAPPEKVRNYFLCYEQVAAYLRYDQKSDSIMGINRVSQRWKNNKELGIGVETKNQILSDQASYGLWGLYSAAMRESGLISGAERRLTKEGLKIVRVFEKKLKRALPRSLVEKSLISKKELQEHAEEFMSALKDEWGNNILLELLLDGSEKNSLQSTLWKMTRQLLEDHPLPASKSDFINALTGMPDIPEYPKSEIQRIKSELQRIANIERLLVALNNIFSYCRNQNGVELKEVIKKLEDQEYDYSYLACEYNDFCKAAIPHKELLRELLVELKKKNYREVILLLLELNKTVMAQRNGAPWVELATGNKLEVTIKNETAHLLRSEQLRTRWDYDYFLGSFMKIANSDDAPISSGDTDV